MGSELDVIRQQRWERLLATLEGGDDWVSRQMLPAARLAHRDERLARLFPFRSLNRLCFSRCSEFPYTNDCPCIVVARSGECAVERLPYRGPGDGEGDLSMGGFGDAALAVALASSALPQDSDRTWIGSSEQGG